jgi:nucleoside-diphosphate-sugar epimerase
MAENGNIPSKPNVLVLGGVGFVGRNLVHYLVTNSLADKIVVADKVMPQMAWLNADHQASFSQVEFRHTNLINPKSVAVLFDSEVKFDFVINCAAETKLGQSTEVYKDGIYKLSCNCAHEAAKHNIQRYVELSTALMQSSDKKPITEDCTCEPWMARAQHKWDVERELSSITDLNYVIVRPAIVYGIGDRSGLTPRLVLGAIYKYLDEPMQMLWTRDYKLSTVHVHDVARALWHVCTHGSRGDVFNLADKGSIR